MFKRLRNRFLIVYMGTIVLLVFVFFTVSLASTLHDIERKSDEAISLSEHAQITGTTPPVAGKRSRFLPTTTITIGINSEIIDVTGYTEMGGEYYTAVTEIALSKKHPRGTFKYDNAYLKYKISDMRLTVLDITRDIEMFSDMLTTFFWIALPMLGTVFFVSYYVSNKWVKPIESAFDKQKEFIASASHELKTPLTAIGANVDVLLKNADSTSGKWLTYIKDEVERMTSLTNSLLYLTKMDFASACDSTKSMDLSGMLTKYLLPYEAVFYENNIKMETSIAPGVSVYVDPEQMRRLISILVDNSIKYTDGEIGISLERVRTMACLSVQNTGVRIERSELPKIWDRFYRGDKSREYTGGFGLGLPIAKAIVDSAKGTITCECEGEKWTRFIVKLPLA